MVCFSHSSLYAPNNLYLILIVAFNKRLNIVDYVYKYVVDIYLLCMIKFRVR